MSERTLSGDDVRWITLWANDAPTSKAPLRQTQAMVRALLRAVPQWQPIATAPRDDRDILCAFKGQFGWTQFVARAFGADTNAAGYARPTHWQPLPEPPQVTP